MLNPRIVYVTSTTVKCQNMFTRGYKCFVCGSRPVHSTIHVADRHHNNMAHLCATCRKQYTPMTIPNHIPESQWRKYIETTLKPSKFYGKV